MPTIADAIDHLEGSFFVGRKRELDAFKGWLGADSDPAVLFVVTGRGGIGKSTLLKAFDRVARGSGRTTILLDSRDFVHTKDGLGRALGDGGDGDIASYLNRERPLVLLDTFEELGDLARYFLDELIPKLETGTKIVVAGRHLAGAGGLGRWAGNPLVRSVELGVLNGEECQDYLARRGLTDRGLIEQVKRIAGGNPLAVSLAADMVLQMGLREFAGVPEWHLAVRSLVEGLLNDVTDPSLRRLLEAASVMRQFDEAALAAVSGDEDIGPAFARLCRMSVVRPTEHGLVLHDDVRRAVADDLRWRWSERYEAMRMRAVAYYKGRMSAASPEEREWLVAELLFLWEDALTRAMAYNDPEPGLVWIDTARPEDRPEMIRTWNWWRAHVLDRDVGFEGDLPGDQELLEAMLDYPDCRVRVARDRDGEVRGFSTALPVCQQSISIMQMHPAFAPMLSAYWNSQEMAALPASCDGSRIWFFVHLCHGESLPEATQAALMRDHIGLYALGDVYLLAAPHPDIKKLLLRWGYQRLPAALNWSWGPNHPVEGFVLDLRRIGVHRWIESILSGEPVPRVLRPAEVEAELQRLLPRWCDDELLSSSPLLQIPAISPTVRGTDRATILRRTIVDIVAAGAAASPEVAEAYRALDMAYIHRAGTHECVAEQLCVSRATFYRLLKRAVRSLSEELSRRSA